MHSLATRSRRLMLLSVFRLIRSPIRTVHTSTSSSTSEPTPPPSHVWIIFHVSSCLSLLFQRLQDLVTSLSQGQSTDYRNSHYHNYDPAPTLIARAEITWSRTPDYFHSISLAKPPLSSISCRRWLYTFANLPLSSLRVSRGANILPGDLELPGPATLLPQGDKNMTGVVGSYNLASHDGKFGSRPGF